MATGEAGENKISFGFSKSIKKPAIINKNIPEPPKVDFIKCVDEKEIKSASIQEKETGDLVIPMRGSKTWHEKLLNNVKANIIESKTVQTTNGDYNSVNIKQEITEDASGISVITLNNDVAPIEVVTIKEEIPEGPAKTLEEQAAQEILRDLKLQGEKTEEPSISVIPLPEKKSLEEEATLEDYEDVPVEMFGKAMLRGMGWQPNRGIGKNAKIVPQAKIHLRPRGLGLGADKLQQVKASKLAENQDLKVVKGNFVKFIIGRYMGHYGQIEGLDDGEGCLVIKLAIGGEIIEVNEMTVQLVSKDEYDKNAKVLNSKKYDEYKIQAEKKNNAVPEEILIEDSSEEDNSKSERHRERNGKSVDQKKSKKYKQCSSDDDSESRRRFKKRRNSPDSEEDNKRKKSKKNKQRSSEEVSESEGRSRKRRNSSDSDEYHKLKRSKKTKKSKKRNSSSERNSHKSKKKHKERESRDSSKRDKHRYRRSRSRSPARR